jgi:transcriptional regulator of arginine metabolism
MPGGPDTDEASLPGIREVLQSFGLEVRQALNLLVLVTTTGSAQPIAAGIDYEDWPEVIGTIAGDDTVLIICPDEEQGKVLKVRIEGYIG